MESLRGPINSLLFGEEMSLDCMESANTTATRSAMGVVNPQMTFLQMLQSAIRQPGVAEETTEEEEEEMEQKNYFQCQFHPESNLELLLQFQNHQQRITDTTSSSIPAVRQATECFTAANTPTPTKESNRKRKRPRPSATAKTAQEAESQRMTHIAVERNRRRLMNSHIHALRSLMPSSFIQRSDQASIIGGAIDFVKELEQLLVSLQAEKRVRWQTVATTTTSSSSESTTLSVSNDGDAPNAVTALDGFFVSPQYTGYSEGVVGVDVEATVVQGHVNHKVVARRRRGQLVRVIAALEELGLLVLHLNITSLDSDSILYSLNLKMEEDCRLGSADEIATAVNQIFTYITAC